MTEDRIYLTGYRGTGKTTVGKLISDQLGSSCIDLDIEIEAAAGKSIREIFAQGGESAFRDWESRLLQQQSQTTSPGSVISLGGGAILRPQNREIIRQTGVCLWLTATPETIASRLADDRTTAQRRPALTELTPVDEIRTVLSEREPIYRESADHVIPTDRLPPEQIAEVAIRWLESAGHVKRDRET